MYLSQDACEFLLNLLWGISMQAWTPAAKWCWTRGFKTPCVSTAQPVTLHHESVHMRYQQKTESARDQKPVLPQGSFLRHMSLLEFKLKGGDCQCEEYVSYIQSVCIYRTMGIHTRTHTQTDTHKQDTMKKIHLVWHRGEWFEIVTSIKWYRSPRQADRAQPLMTDGWIHRWDSQFWLVI